MDLYGSVDPTTGALTGQVHDFNPGIRPSGLFWIQPVPEEALDVDLEAGEAALSIDDLAERDYHTLPNSLAVPPGPFDPASVSFEMHFKAFGPTMTVTRSDQGFRGKFRFSKVDIEWSAKVGSFRFESDTTMNVDSVMGSERNGVFF
jgi:hypothetical protein